MKTHSQGACKVHRMSIPEPLKEELDDLVEKEMSSKRWTPEAEAVLAHYYIETDASITTLCKVLEKAFPDQSWPYSVVNSRVQYLKKLGCFDGKKGVK